MINLTKRQLSLIRVLLTVKQTTAGKLAKQLSVSSKTIYNDLKILQPILAEQLISIHIQPRRGISLTGSVGNYQRVLKKLSQKYTIPDSDLDRQMYILVKLLQNNRFFTLEYFSERLFIGTKTIERNLKQLDIFLKETGVRIERHPKKGIILIATEKQKRKMLYKILNLQWGGGHWSVDERKTQPTINYQGTLNNSFLSQEIVQHLIKIVDDFSKEKRISFTDYAFQSLVIHLAIAVQRIRDGNSIINTKSISEKKIENQLNNARYLARMIEQKFKLIIPSEEIGYIQIHLIASSPNKLNIQITDQKFVNTLKEILSVFGYDHELLVGLSVHLFSAFNRLKAGATITNPYTLSIKENYTRAFDAGIEIAKYYKLKNSIEMNDDEIAYLALHLEAYLERMRAESQQLDIVLVCSTGLGSAQLLAAKIRKEFPDLKINGIWSVNDLREKSLAGIDLVISTIEINIEGIRTIQVSPILRREEIEGIKNTIKNSHISRQSQQHGLDKLIQKKLVFTDIAITDFIELIKWMSHQLYLMGYAKKGIAEVPSSVSNFRKLVLKIMRYHTHNPSSL
nr:transcription antiterminator [Liquorilactobacillus satsumensis]